MMDYDVFGNLEQQREEALNLASMNEKAKCIKYHDTFDTEAGKLVLADLISEYLDKPSIPDNYSFFESIGIAHRREGQNSVVRDILKRINKAIEE